MKAFRVHKKLFLKTISIYCLLSLIDNRLYAVETECAESVRLTNSDELGEAAAKRIRGGDFPKGIRLLKKAIEKNLRYDVLNISGSSGSESKLPENSFGCQQVRQMLNDRPEMAKHVKEGDAIWCWASNRFAGTEGCGPMFWVSTEPSFQSDQIPPSENSPGRVRVSKMIGNKFLGDNMADKMWSCLVFELFNSCYGEYYQELFDKAIYGKLSKTEFVKGVFIAEMYAIDDTRHFYANVYLPWAEKNGVVTNPTNWFANHWWGDKDQLFEGCKAMDTYPWVPYSDYYEACKKAGKVLKLHPPPPMYVP